MKNIYFLLTFFMCFSIMNVQAQSNQNFTLLGKNLKTIPVGQTFTSSTEILPFSENMPNIYGMAIDAEVVLLSNKSIARVVLIDQNFNEHLIYEIFPLLSSNLSLSVDDICEETNIVEGIKPYSLYIELEGASINLKEITYATGVKQGFEIQQAKIETRLAQVQEKAKMINSNLQKKGLKWRAGATEVAQMTYQERKKLFGQSKFPAGIEYYAGGIMSFGETPALKSAAEASPYIPDFDWRNRHGKNWITPVKNQGGCGSCWAFAATGAVEAMANLFFNNDQLDLNLSEQDMLSCSGAGTCAGGYPSTTLDYIKQSGIVDEATFPYDASDLACSENGSFPNELIQIAGRINYGVTEYPRTYDGLKKMIIEMGPISGGIYDWSHAMVLAGYYTVKEGATFRYSDGLTVYDNHLITIEPGNALIGKTLWIFKNSWGSNWGDGGYSYFEVDPSRIGWTHGITTPVTSEIVSRTVHFEDADGDGFYWWGLGEKPTECPGSDLADGNDNDNTLGPLDEFGYCTVIGETQAPVANFSATPTIVTENQSVQFTDLSSNNPLSWSWTFEGGTPATSTAKNPVVTYNSAGNHDVTLIASNAGGDSEPLTKTNYITVNVYVPEYCDLNGNASAEWIDKVTIGTNSYQSGSSGTAGYQDLLNTVFQLENGQLHNVVLEPGFDPRSKFEYWAIWIDYNADNDFDDPGEKVFTANKKRSSVTGSFTIPTLDLNNGPIETRMRITMSRSALTSVCGTFDAGEVEDYTVIIGEPAPDPLIADFVGEPRSVVAGNTVSFTDLSNYSDGTTYAWSFPGGTPGTSSDRNPTITYSTLGTYNVSLTVTRGIEINPEEKTAYITVTNEPVPEYCTPSNLSSLGGDFIQQISLATTFSFNGFSGYQTPTFIDLPSGNMTITLVPNNLKNRNFWRIWIDLNDDQDFDDSGETLLALNNKKGSVSTSVNIPSTAHGQRMRITMRTNSAPAPCDDGFNGEVKDYTVSIVSSPQLKQAFINKDNNLIKGIQIYPNPTNNKVTLHVGEIFEGDLFQVFDMRGALIKDGLITDTNSEINFSNCKSGSYLIKVVNGHQIYNEKIVKQ